MFKPGMPEWIFPFRYLVLSVFFLLPIYNHAQCAGEDASISICDIANPDNQSINLFAALGGSPTAGGIWIDPLQTTALDLSTGILNVWNIHISGTYSFTYMVNNPGCADNSATIFVTVGGYSGIPSPNGSACNDDEDVNLFQFFVGTLPDPHLNGSWSDDDATGAVSGSKLDATLSGLGTFHFTYTMPAIGSCPAMSSTIALTVYKIPEPGTPVDLLVCNTSDLSLLSNLNLADLLAGEDPNGLWSESDTSELSSLFDSFVDVQHIYETLGLGTYSFTYTVYPTNPVCDIKTATIRIIIEEPLDFTGAVLTINSDICENEMAGATYSASLTQGTIINPSGSYTITYEISGAASSIHTTPAVSFNTFGILAFPISDDFFPAVGDYTVTITKILYSGNKGACENIINASDELHIYPIPKINSATLTIDPVCVGNGVTVALSGNTNLSDGSYEITYNLTGANILAAQTITLNVLAGIASFDIAASAIPNAGNTVLHITHILNIVTGCENSSTLTKSFSIIPVITVNPALAIADACQSQPVVVFVSGLGSLASIDITYELAGANIATAQALNLTVSDGNASFIIPDGLLPNLGTMSCVVTFIFNNNSDCPVIFEPVADNFTINAEPSAPISQDLIFCNSDNATIADLVPNGPEFDWFLSEAATTPLDASTALVSGVYYVSQNNEFCTSARAMANITIISVNTPELIQDGQEFCGIDNPTISDLSANILNQDAVIWYDAPNGGNQLDASELLQQDFTYYGFGVDTVVDCISPQSLSVTVTLTNCDGNPHDFFIPDGFSPNGDGVNDTWQIPEIQFLFPDYTYEIYNRYGNLLFKGNIDRPGWDGRNTESQTLIDGINSNGVYYYVLNFNKENAAARQGFLYLNR